MSAIRICSLDSLLPLGILECAIWDSALICARSANVGTLCSGDVEMNRYSSTVGNAEVLLRGRRSSSRGLTWLIVGLMPDGFIEFSRKSSQMKFLPPHCTLNGHLSICRTGASRVLSMTRGGAAW